MVSPSNGAAGRVCFEFVTFNQPALYRPAAYLTATTTSNVSINRIAMTHARAKRIVVGFGS
jgi:hypothetical protein